MVPTEPTPTDSPHLSPFFLERSHLENLVQLLRAQGYEVIAPTVVQGVIALRPIESAGELPQGVHDRQQPGSYRLEEDEEPLNFSYVVGPDGPKRYVFPPEQLLYRFHLEDGDFAFDEGTPEVPKLAFLGIRPCELAAMRIQDRVFGITDPATFRCESFPWYRQIREQSLYVAVNCTHPGGTCFCVSWKTGPKAEEGFDLSLTELRDGFVLEVGSERGADLVAKLPVREPTGAELELAELKLHRASEHMGRQIDPAAAREILQSTIEHPAWDQVAKRCLSCANCTMVCPTCFCSTVTDATDLSDGSISRTRSWESCFTHQFTFTTSGPGRESIRGRYRHWLRHKLCTWWDQFGTSGCVGCGRCLTWCPAAIDLTEEVARLSERPVTPSGSPTVPSGSPVASPAVGNPTSLPGGA